MTQRELRDKIGSLALELSTEEGDSDWLTDEVINFINTHVKEEKKALLDKIDPFDLVHDCQPDCTKEQHAYHEGTWTSHLKLDSILSELRAGIEEDK